MNDLPTPAPTASRRPVRWRFDKRCQVVARRSETASAAGHAGLAHRLSYRPAEFTRPFGEEASWRFARYLLEAGLLERRVDGNAPERYYVTALAPLVLGALGVSLQRLSAEQQRGSDPTIRELTGRADQLAAKQPKSELLSIAASGTRELAACLEASLPIAAFCLSGRVLESSIKHHLLRRGKSVDGRCMLGQLIGLLDKDDRFLLAHAELIKLYRNNAAHASAGDIELCMPEAIGVARLIITLVIRTFELPLHPVPGSEWSAQGGNSGMAG
jgi:hypothetical protein